MSAVLDDVDPKAYIMRLQRKRDVVDGLLAQHALRHSWDTDEQLTVTTSHTVGFDSILRDHELLPFMDIPLVKGVNTMHRFWWNEGVLDTLAWTLNPL